MKIKSAKSFRQWYKNLTPARKQAAQFWDENFIGTQHNDLSGFFAMYHGDKTHIYDFLRKEVEMAEDGQAIYEFVQNAADSDSTKFYMFYDENYLIVINNGSVFSKEGVKSILNIGQSFGKQEPDKIGRYGIGFKLVHRLVGKSSGLDELLNVDKQGHKGPILFSWSEKSQFNNFLSSNEFEYVDFDHNKAPWLLKILITNFPAQPIEKVKDIDYNVIEPFQEEELKSFQTFLNSYIDKIDLNSLDSGTVFFLKLGDKKFEYLERQKQEYLNGVSTSMHFLKSLDTLVINENIVHKDKEATNFLEFTIQNGSDDFNEIGLTEVRDKESDAKFKICFADNANSANEIKKHPNIYKYFPAVKEVNYLSFVIHSNLFELSSNRQNLTETPINKKLLGLLSKKVINKMEFFKSEKGRNTFKKLFTSILMSDKSSSNSSGNGWQNEYFYNILLEYIRKAIPTKDKNFSDNTLNVKINKLKLNLDLANLGLSHIQWFEWDKEEDEILIKEAKKTEKLGIEEWDIRNIIENADLESINKWIAACNESTYEVFIREIEKIYFREETKTKLFEIKLIKFSDNRFYSINELWTTVNVIERFQERTYNQYKKTYEYTTKTRVIQKSILNQSIIFSTDKTINISKELQNLDFAVSLKNISTYKNIYSVLSEKLPKEKETFNAIAEKCKTNTLSAGEKKNLFLNFINETTTFDTVPIDSLKNLELFCNSNLEIKPLNELIGNIKTASWLNAFKIKQDEYFPELDSFLISESEDIFKLIYKPNQENIIADLTTPEEIKLLIKLYQANQKSFFKEFIIKKANKNFTIEKRTNEIFQIRPNKETRQFVKDNLENTLISLPFEFDEECKDEEGIFKGEQLYELILKNIEVDDFKEQLVDIIHYDEPKLIFLKKLSEVRFNIDTEYTKENYEYKILDLACKALKSPEYYIFRNKFVVETAERSFNYSEIPKKKDSINIATKDFSLSKILPSTYQNSNLISDLVTNFSKQGISRENLNTLFGVNEEFDLDDLFEIFLEQLETLQNAEQLFFLIYYHIHIAKVDLSKLGFDIECAVFPSDFALESEKLPEYLQNWIKQDEIKTLDLNIIGVYTENSTLVSLRKFFLTKSDFNHNTIAQDEKLSDGKILLNSFQFLKEKKIELIGENEIIVLKEMVRVINSSRVKGKELIIQEEYNFALLEEQSTKWKSIGEFSIYLFNGSLPKIVKLNEIQDYIFYRYNDSDYAVNGKNIYVNEYEDKNKTLQKVALDCNNDFTSEDSKDIELSEVKAELEKFKKQGQSNEDNTNSNFLDDVNDFISELEGTEWNSFVPELKNIVELSVSHPKEIQKLFNLIAKIKLTKEMNVKFEDSDEGFNAVKIGNEKYFVHSARGAFAYIHPIEILKMKEVGYKMALDFSTKSRIKIYDTAEEILELNTNHILAYQHEKTMDELFTFCQANRDAHKHLLIIDKNNSGEKSRALLKLLNIDDDYQ